MADIVGTAYVRIRAITTGIGNDIKDSIEKGMDTDAIGNAIKKPLTKHSQEAGEESGKGFVTRFREAFRSEFGKSRGSFKGVFDSFKKTFRIPGKFWLIGLGIPALGGALKIAGAYLTTLVAQLGYVVTAAVGAGAALAGAVGLAAIGIVPLIMAFKTETEALDKFKESLEEQADAWKEVGSAVQEGLLPPLTEATQLLSSEFIPMFTEVGRTVGRIFGDVVRRISNVLTTEGAMQSWGEVFKSVEPFMTAIGDALVQIARILPPLLEVTAPLAVELAEAIAGAARNFADFITAGAESGTLGANLQLWWDRAKLIGESLWNIIEALWEIFRVGADVVSPQFENLRDITQGWVDFLRSDEGSDRLAQIFENALPVAQEVNGLIGDIIELIMGPILEGDTAGVLGFLQTIRNDVLPPLADLAKVLAENIGGSLNAFVPVLIDFLTAMAESGALGVFLSVITNILEILTDLLQLPGMAEFIGGFLALFAAISAIVTVVSPFIGLFVKIVGIFKNVALIFGWVKAALTAIAIVFGTTIGPVIAVIAGIIAVIVGVILAIKNWDKIVEWAKGIWEKVTEFFSNLWDNITEFVSSIPGLIGDAIGALGRFIGGIIQFLLTLPQRLLRFMAQAAVALWQWILDAIPKVLEFLGNLLGSIIGFLISIPGRIIEFMVLATQALWSWIQDAVPIALEWLGNLIGSILGFLLSLPGRIVAATIAASKALWNWVKDAAPKVLEWLGNIATGIFRWFTDTLPKLIARGAELLTGFLKWIVDAAKQIPGKLAEFAGKVFTWIGEFIREIPERLANGIQAIFNFGKSIINAIVDGLNNAIQKVWDWARTFINAVIDGIIDNAGWLAGPLRKLFGRGGGGTTTQAASTGGGGGVTGFSALGRSSTLTTPLAAAGAGASANSALQAQGPRTASGVSLVVQIGERDITDIVDARISDNDLATSQALFVTRRG